MDESFLVPDEDTVDGATVSHLADLQYAPPPREPRRKAFGMPKLLRQHPWFIFVVVLPTLAAAIYYMFIAADIYSSESRFVIRSPGQKQTQSSTLANLIQTTGLSSGQDETNEIIEYLRSRDAVTGLEKQIGLRKRFASSDADWIARYPSPFRKDRLENLYRYYGKMVTARTDNDTGVAVLEVKAFTAKDASAINGGLLDLSEQLVNKLNARAQIQAISESLKRVSLAEARVRDARMALERYRNAEGLLDPTVQGTGVLEVSNRLVSEQAALRAQLDVMTSVTPSNPAIPSIRGQIAAIGRQIDAQNGRAVGTTSGIASKLGNYQKLSLEQEFAAQMLTAANTSLEQQRADAQKQQFYLERVVEPDVPDLARYPARMKLILTVFAASFGLYLIGWMFVVGILEHAPED